MSEYDDYGFGEPVPADYTASKYTSIFEKVVENQNKRSEPMTLTVTTTRAVGIYLDALAAEGFYGTCAAAVAEELLRLKLREIQRERK